MKEIIPVNAEMSLVKRISPSRVSWYSCPVLPLENQVSLNGTSV